MNEAKDTTKDEAQEDAGNPINRSHPGVSEADEDESCHKEVELIWAEKAFGEYTGETNDETCNIVTKPLTLANWPKAF